MAKKNTPTQLIEVPLEFANEVKLFTNLLKTGEIDDFAELLHLAGLGQPDLSDKDILLNSNANQNSLESPSSDLDNLWSEVLNRVQSPLTKALLRQKAQLLDLDESSAIVGFQSKSLLKINQNKISLIEQAFNCVLGHKVKVELVESAATVNRSTISNLNKITNLEDYPQSRKNRRINLTEDQQKALVSLKSFTESQDKFFRLTGYAGTGKSFLICRYLEWLKSTDYSFVAACPTNKAAKSLENLAATENLGLEVKTIAQLLGQQPEFNEKTGKEEFICNGKADLSGYSVVIIDEFSMVNQENFKELIKAAQSSLLTKVIFVGDAAQLPPVKEKEPIVATSPLIERDATLSSVVRYDGQIAHIAEVIRSDPKYNRAIYPFRSTDDATILVVPETEWLARAIELFESEAYKLNPDLVRFLGWRNKTVKSLNQFVRKKLWGDEALPYVSGDRLIARKPLFRTKPGGKGKNKWRILINNSEEATVIRPGELKELVFQKEIYQYWHVEVKPEAREKPYVLSILHEDYVEKHAAAVKHFASKKQWSYYFDLSRMFDDVGYGYALTTHKAQGSTIDYVFLDVKDMKGCRDRQKLLYTALTRAKRQAIISE